jgi:hypothetical protein
MTSPGEQDDFDSLVADMLHGIATAESANRLETMLRADAGKRAMYLDRALLHAHLAATPLAAGLIAATPRHRMIVPAPQEDDATAGRLSSGSMVRTGLVALAAGVVAMLAMSNHDRTGWNVSRMAASTGAASGLTGGYDTRQLPAQTIAMLASPSSADRPLVRMTLAAAGHVSRLRTVGGADLQLDAPGVLGLVSQDAGALFQGGVQARVSGPGQSYTVEAANLRIVDRGTEFRVDRVDEDRIAVSVFDGEVEVQSRLRPPLASWSFNEFSASGGTAVDAVHGLEAVAGEAVKPVAGLVGGAAAFDNSRAASLQVVGGTGTKVGTGLLSFSTGISIEALIVSQWSGELYDYDEIWRKEDGNSRVLLSFQNDEDKNAVYSVPAVGPGPCLSFGLQLAAPGVVDKPRYDELDMPLDGRNGRPTLAELTDGRPHHVVATFDSFTGIKAIYIDGRLRFSHAYPAGSLIVSGGPEPGFIGSHRGIENFTGSIDELSLYDFALSADEVTEHHRRLMSGQPAVPAELFRQRKAGEPPGHWQAITRLVAGQTRVFNQHSGLPAELGGMLNESGFAVGRYFFTTVHGLNK